MKKVKKKKLGVVAVKPTGPFDSNRNYRLLEECLYDHDSWYSTHGDNQGNTPTETPDANGVVHWRRGTDGGSHAYQEGETAKGKGNTAEQKGNTAQEQGNGAYEKGELASAAARLAALIAQNPPKVGCTIDGHQADDHYWYYAVPKNDLSGVDYVSTGVWAKGDNLDWESLTEQEKQRIIGEILASFAEVTEEEAAAIFGEYVFQTTD